MSAQMTWTRAAEIMAERVRRSTGRAVTVENAGGGNMVAVAQAPTGSEVIVFHPEGYAVYADMAAWRDGEEAEHADGTAPLDTVTAVLPWLADAQPAR